MEKRDIDIKEIIKDVKEDIIFASLTPEAIDKWKRVLKKDMTYTNVKKIRA